MSTVRFDREVGDLTGSLGDPTRRRIYLAVRASPEPVTTAIIAETFAVHTNVARHHLDRLVADGYLQVSRRRRAGKVGPGAGRPAKHYEATTREVALAFPVRRFDLLTELLARMIDHMPRDEASHLAEEVGREYGLELAAEMGLDAATDPEAAAEAVARAFTAMGFETEARPADGILLTTFCPFGDAATNHPEVVCRLDQGIVRGLLEASSGEAHPIAHPHRTPDEACIVTL